MTPARACAVACVVSLLACPGIALAQSAPAPYVPSSGQPGKDVVWVPTDQGLVDRMLDMARVTADDYLVDLGSGDGRTVITAAKRGARALGIEYNPDMVALSRRAAEAEGVAERAEFRQGDIFEADFSQATVVTLFLLPDLNLRLRPTLLAMKPGTRIVSNTFTMGDWVPDEATDGGGTCASFCHAYKWIVPARIEGGWRMGDDDLDFAQTFQTATGTLGRGGRTVAVERVRLEGATISFLAAGRRYTGTVEGDVISGTTDDGRTWTATRRATG